MNKEYKIKLDLNKKLYNKKMAFNQFDENVNDFYIEVTKNNELVKDLDKSIVTLVAIKPNNTVDAQFIEVKEGQIYADLKPSMCDLVGNYQAKAMIVLEGEIVTTDTINYSVNEDKIISRLNDDIVSDERFTLFTDALARLSTIESSEEQRMINEAERILSEENRKIEEAKRVEAELVRQHKEADRSKYDAIRESNENIRKQNESIRLANETNRIDEEAKRVDEENKRKLAEEERNANYNFMTEDEERRRTEANAHKEAEALRVQAETNRVNEEAKRRTVEATRIVNEKNRQRIFEEKVLEVKNAINSIPSKSELKGEKGDKGDRGEQGIQGEQGLQGEKGDKGDKGEQGIQGLKGDKGDKGDVGPQGEQGLKGDNGVTPNITIGTVTTLEPNQQATVTRRGTDVNPIFDFGIPKGEKGEGGTSSSSGTDNIGMKLLVEYTHTGNQEIHFSNINWATGEATTTTPHGLTGKTEIFIVPNDWSLVDVLNNLTSVPIEWITNNNRITVVPNGSNGLLIRKNDGTTTMPVNTNDISNGAIDFTKFHFEIPVPFSFENFPKGVLNYRFVSRGYIKASGQYRYTGHSYYDEFGAIKEASYINLLGTPSISVGNPTHCVFGSQIWDIYADNGYIRVDVNNVFQGRRKGYDYIVWDSSFEKTTVSSLNNFKPCGLAKFSTHSKDYAYISNNSLIQIYDLGGR